MNSSNGPLTEEAKSADEEIAMVQDSWKIVDKIGTTEVGVILFKNIF